MRSAARFIGLLAVLGLAAGCGGGDSGDADGAATTLAGETTTTAVADPALVDACVRYVQYMAFMGDAIQMERWDAVGRDPAVLAGQCGQMAVDTPDQVQGMQAEMAAIDAAAAAPAPAVQPPTDPAAGTGAPGNGEVAVVSTCDANYFGACVPVAADVDCEGSGEDGPVFVKGPFTVYLEDVYGLDPDGDGIACSAL